jgi:uncharacterized protein YkwD
LTRSLPPLPRPRRREARPDRGRPPAVEEAIAFFKSAQPLAPVTADALLSLAARARVRDLGASGVLTHAGADGSLPEDRVRRYGNPTNVGELLNARPSQPRSIVIALLVDDNIRDRGHRLAIMDPAYRLAGASIQPHASRHYTDSWSTWPAGS